MTRFTGKGACLALAGVWALAACGSEAAFSLTPAQGYLAVSTAAPAAEANAESYRPGQSQGASRDSEISLPRDNAGNGNAGGTGGRLRTAVIGVVGGDSGDGGPSVGPPIAFPEDKIEIAAGDFFVVTPILTGIDPRAVLGMRVRAKSGQASFDVGRISPEGVYTAPEHVSAGRDAVEIVVSVQGMAGVEGVLEVKLID